MVAIPVTHIDVVGLSVFAISHGLDWVATGPAIFALTNQLFGHRNMPVFISWIFVGHQVWGALAAFGAGVVRSATGDYLLVFMTNGLARLLAALLVNRPTPTVVPYV